MPIGGFAQRKLPTKEDVDKELRRRGDVFNSGNLDAILQNSHDHEVFGFGWRTAAPRSTGWSSVDSRDVAARGAEAFREPIKRFLDSMEYYHCEVEELHTSVEGDIGLAWGIWVEDFKVRDRPAEKARVRFTEVLKKEGEHWRLLLSHRDIQPFDEHGRYLTQFTLPPPR
jgi:hypothetical protein